MMSASESSLWGQLGCNKIRAIVAISAAISICLLVALTPLTEGLWLRVCDPPPPRNALSPPVAEPYARLLAVPHHSTLGLEQLQRGVVSQGERTRLRNFVRKLAHGEPVNVGFLGASITVGQGSTYPSERGYAPLVYKYLHNVSEAVGYNNAGVGAVSNGYFAMCMSNHLKPDNDLIVVDMCVNDMIQLYDASHSAHESILRQLLALPRRPAVVEAMFPRLFTYYRGRPLFSSSHADQIGVLAQYYNLPWVATRSAFWPDFLKGAAGYALDDLVIEDRTHPTDRGHAIMADLLIHLLRQEAQALGTSEPWTKLDERLLARETTEPMLEATPREGTPGVCRVGEAARQLALPANSTGFEWVDEGKPGNPKWGWVGRKVGDELMLQFSTIMDSAASLADLAKVHFMYLRSYDQMGIANVTCVLGCTCPHLQIDSLKNIRASETTVVSLPVSQSPSCVLSVEILERPKDPSLTKFKVVGIGISL